MFSTPDSSNISLTTAERDTTVTSLGYAVPKKRRVSDEYYPCCSFFGAYIWDNPHPPCNDAVKLH